jgi:hypothetical protein
VNIKNSSWLEGEGPAGSAEKKGRKGPEGPKQWDVCAQPPEQRATKRRMGVSARGSLRTGTYVERKFGQVLMICRIGSEWMGSAGWWHPAYREVPTDGHLSHGKTVSQIGPNCPTMSPIVRGYLLCSFFLGCPTLRGCWCPVAIWAGAWKRPATTRHDPRPPGVIYFLFFHARVLGACTGLPLRKTQSCAGHEHEGDFSRICRIGRIM